MRTHGYTFLAFLFTIIFLSSNALSQPFDVRFTYQGQLKDSSSNANGLYDMRFRALNDDDSQIGPTIVVQNVEVIDGLFDVVLDFSDTLFTDPEMFLQIEIKAAGNASYTTLSPNTPMGTSPRAGVALHAIEAQSLTNPIWNFQSPAHIANTGADDRLLLNRSETITGADYFTLGIPDHGGTYGGMYIDAFHEDQLAFYGFSINDSARAWIQYRNQNQSIEFKFNTLEFTALSVSPQGTRVEGELVIAGDVEQEHSNGTRFQIGPKAYGAVSSGGGFPNGGTPNIVSTTWMGSNGGGTAYCVIDFDSTLNSSHAVSVTPREDRDNYYATYEIKQGDLHVYVWDGSRTTAHSVQLPFSFIVYGE